MMYKETMRFLILLALLTWQPYGVALTIEITQGAEGALPIAVVPFGWTGPAPGAPQQDLAEIIAADLGRSGRFKPLGRADMLARPTKGEAVDFRDWRALAMENLVVGEISPNGPGGYLVRFQLFDVFRGEQVTGYSIPTTERDLRATAHHIADIVYESLTGEPGAFATRIAYVTSVRRERWQRSGGAGDRRCRRLRCADHRFVCGTLDVAAWSPDGRKVAYVSFENRKAAIWIQEVFTGQREKVASFKGINGAPSWSPDGRSLALTLSKDGNPDIFIMDLARRSIRPLTRHWGIDTEPDWSPDGKHIVFTSDRGGARRRSIALTSPVVRLSA